MAVKRPSESHVIKETTRNHLIKFLISEQPTSFKCQHERRMKIKVCHSKLFPQQKFSDKVTCCVHIFLHFTVTELIKKQKRNFSQMISAADVQQRLLFGAISKQAQLARAWTCWKALVEKFCSGFSFINPVLAPFLFIHRGLHQVCVD